MNVSAAHIVTRTQPMWQSGHSLPVPMQTVYTVLARRDTRWSTVLAKTPDIHHARDTMNRASDSGQYDRVVIARGHSINRAPASNWQTVECALPARAVAPSEFQKLVDDLQSLTANTPRDFYQVGAIESCNVFLIIAMCLAGINMNVPALFGISFLALFEAALLSDTRPHHIGVTRVVNHVRYWGYALLIGGLVFQLLQAQ